ncbi:TonB-dependent receptor [Altererythrobacter aurantiacus]|uniref:TonB-dependent receptor n=1 Tax=Parapontixanthobacter aurantiacus TaxID=1463599 RepID=A0A844ZB86_9SPHN|nr:TonB-dependent receptor [Parapontixanthobacter aurantiacus]MXO84456.1 TonB-dependent receptor [Parapontixanthobacter aurantiacus]
MKFLVSKRSAKAILLAGSALAFSSPVFAQDAGTLDDDEVSDAASQSSAEITEDDNVIVVSGFRESLNAAISAKREAVGQVDVIVAEDIAKFPDTNLAESLQRIPGVAIERDAGEGRQITVRGLGAQFTRVRVNGMETIATSVDGASFNRDRAFDFNIFASELFNSIVVNKTASASLDEGSLGAVIDLNTGNPLAYGAGLKFVGSAQARYNDLNDDLSPRLAGLLAWNNADETFGVSASAAWTKYETPELGNNTVRWTDGSITQRPDGSYSFTNIFRTVDGVNCRANPTDAGCNEVADAFHPRIPRYGLVNHDRERLGATGAIEFRPSDSTDIEINALYSNFKEDRDEYWGEVLIRSNESSIDLTNYTIDGDNNVISGDLTNAWIRNERYHRESETDFYQVSGQLEQRFGDQFAATLFGGFSKSDAQIPVETTIIFDDRDGVYSYDYSDMRFPLLVFGTDVTNPANFQLAEFRDRPSSVENKFKTVSLDLEWEPVSGLTLSAGPFYRQFDYFTTGARRDSVYCSAFSCAAGTYGAPVTQDLAELFQLGEAGQPAGNTNSWIVPDLDAAVAFLDLYNRPAVLQQGDERSVQEKTKGAYFQTDFEIDEGLRITGNFGVRYAHTDQSSQGFNNGQFVTVERTYDDFLPAVNINVFPTDNFILRGAVAQVITRPSLGSLTPGGSVDQFNFRISTGNPFIDPYRAWNYDVSAEWYFAPGAILSLAGFVKDIESFPVGNSLQVTYAQSGLPTSLLTSGTPAYDAVVNGTNPTREFEFRTTTNGEGAIIKGLELGMHLPFSVFSDGAFSDFGVLGNVTYVDSNQDVEFQGEIFETTFPGVSKYSANGTAYYDNGRLSVRVSGAYRSDYNTGNSGNGNFLEGFDSSFNLDAAVRYKITDTLELTLDGNNLTDDYRYRWTDDVARRNYENNHFGRIIMAGVRFEY